MIRLCSWHSVEFLEYLSVMISATDDVHVGGLCVIHVINRCSCSLCCSAKAFGGLVIFQDLSLNNEGFGYKFKSSDVFENYTIISQAFGVTPYEKPPIIFGMDSWCIPFNLTICAVADIKP